MAHSAIHIGYLTTSTADDVMVVVAHAALVESRRANGLNAADDASFGQQGERVVDRLTRDSSDVGLGLFGDSIGGAVRKCCHCAHHGKALGRDMKAMGSQNFGEIGIHEVECSKVWTYIKF